MGAGGVGVELLAGHAVKGGDDVRGDALRDEVVVKVGVRVECQGAAVGAHGDAGHGLHAADEDEVVPAGADLLCAEVHGGEAGGAVAVDLQAGGGVRQAGVEGGGAGDVHALVADGGHAAGDDVTDGVGVDARVALDEGLDEAAEQVNGLDGVEGSAWLSLASGGADGVVDEGLWGASVTGHDSPWFLTSVVTKSP